MTRVDDDVMIDANFEVEKGLESLQAFTDQMETPIGGFNFGFMFKGFSFLLSFDLLVCSISLSYF